jgi:hypothetical protein
MPVQTSNSTTVIDPFAANGAVYFLPSGIFALVDNNSAYSSSNGGTLNISGTVGSFSTAISVGAVSTTTRISITASGSVTGSGGSSAISTNGLYVMNNAGTILATGSDTPLGILTTGSGIITNSGTISGNAYSYFGFSSND